MPLNTIQQHVQGLLNGLAIPNQPETLVAYITPPVIEAPDGPRAYVWGGTQKERRSTSPRPYGFKRITWMVDIYVIYLTSATDADLDEAFPLCLDAIEAALRAAPMPIPVTDPTTRVVSQLVAIGEDFEMEYLPERLADTGRLLWYTARIGATVMEDVQS